MLDDPLPTKFYAKYTEHDLRHIRDLDRRFYRKVVIWMVAWQVIVLGPVRLMIDKIFADLKFPWLLSIKPYVILFMVAVVFLMWAIAILTFFKRRY